MLRCRQWPSRVGTPSAIYFRCTSRSGNSSAPTRPAGRRPSIFTRPLPNSYLTAELPGLSRDQIEIHAEQYRIVIRGARAAVPSGDVACEQFHRIERGHGRFSRAFTLPEAIDVDNISADLKDGILTVAIPKAGDRHLRRIDVT